MVALVLPNENLSPSVMVLSFISACLYIMALSVFPNRRLFRLARVSRHYLISQITVYFGLPKYHGIISITKSPFISVCKKITAFISYHQVSHNCRLCQLNQLSWFFSYPSIIASVSRLNESKSITAH